MTDIKILNNQILSNNWYVLNKVTYEITHSDGTKHIQNREAYDRGNGAVILLYNVEHRSIVLTKQFRLPTFLNGNPSGMLIEACAGLLDEDNAEDCIKRETEEETGYQVSKVNKVFEAYMSPGSVTEILYFFVAAYDKSMKVHHGGGLAHEEEQIEVIELPFEDALEMIYNGEIKDAKTIMLIQHLRLKGIL